MEALLIARTDIAKYTSLDGNIDYDKILPFVKTAQDIWIQQYTGTNLLVKIKNDILNDTLTGNYLSIVNTFLKPMLIHFTMIEYLPFASFQISNQGVNQRTVENGQVATQENIQYLTEKYKRIAENYAQRFIDYMNFNNNLFPEYLNNNNEKINPQQQNYLGGWHI